MNAAEIHKIVEIMFLRLLQFVMRSIDNNDYIPTLPLSFSAGRTNYASVSFRPNCVNGFGQTTGKVSL